MYVCACVCVARLGTGIETVCRKWQFQAELRWQTLSAHFLCAARQGGTHRKHARTLTHACTHTRAGSERGRALAWRAVQRNEREREGSRKGGRREFSREQHFPTVWGFDTWLSHIPQPCGRPRTGTQGKEGERETDREEGSTPGACKQYRVMEGRECVSLSACLHVPPRVCFNMCLPPAPALNPFTAGSSDRQQTQDGHLFYGPTAAVVLSLLSAKVQTQ